MMFTPTSDRVSHNTAETVNEQIRRQTEQTIADCIRHGPAAIDRRIAELDGEWDVERCLETVAPTFTLLGLALGITTNRKWLILPAVVQSFFLQHALQGWCPPVPVLRRLGVRTANEIGQERYALKALRGDFEMLAGVPQTSHTARVREALGATQS
jgi:hypothetical protein